MRKLLVAALLVAGVGFAASISADSDERKESHKEKSHESEAEVHAREAVEIATRSMNHQDAVINLVMARDIPITYDYIETLMRLPNAFGEGAACIICHSSNDPKVSYRGLDLTSCEGILKGSMEPPARPIIHPGDENGGGLLKRHLRNNRMPLGVAFDYPTDTPNILSVKKWLDDGANNDDFFNTTVLPLFAQRNAFGSPLSCTDCHMSNQEPPSFHELDMTSYEGIMLGADAIAKAKEGKPPVKIVKPGNSAESKLYQRLVENRMPAGISPAEDRDHPNMQLLMQWIKQGARCK
ncbi:MAG: hypothetical protein C0631_13455 [Sedimenticola sp.]|nr:MAG: hypothetical protein C0631_13455 [Sedimenticola sp.]